MIMADATFGPIIVRIAGWPIEALNHIRSSRLACEVDLWIRSETLAHVKAKQLACQLYRIIPTLPARTSRAALLELRRYILRCMEPIPDKMIVAALHCPDLPPRLVKEISKEESRRLLLLEKKKKLRDYFFLSRQRELKALRRIGGTTKFRKALYLASPSAYSALNRADPKRKEPEKIDYTLFCYLTRAVGRATPNGTWAGVALEDAEDALELQECTLQGRDTNTVTWSPSLMTNISGSDTSSQHVFENSDNLVLEDIFLDEYKVKICFTPAISPFWDIFRNFVCNQSFQEAMSLMVNPTLVECQDNTWLFSIPRDGTWIEYQAGAHPIIKYVCAFSNGNRTFSQNELAAFLQQSSPLRLSVAESQKWIKELLRFGVLVSNIEIPRFFSDAWECIDAMISQLPGSEKNRWGTVLSKLLEVAKTLETSYHVIQLGAIETHLDKARQCVNHLREYYGLPNISTKKHVLIADFSFEVSISFSPQVKKHLEHSIRTFWEFDWLGLGEIFATSDRHLIFGPLAQSGEIRFVEAVAQGIGLDKGLPFECCAPGLVETISQDAVGSDQEGQLQPPWKVLASSPNGCWEYMMGTIDKNFASRAVKSLNLWHSYLEPHYKARAVVIPDSFFALSDRSGKQRQLPPGSALFRLGRHKGAFQARLGPITSDPCVFYSRFHCLFKREAKEHDNFSQWYKQALKHIERQYSGLYFADVAINLDQNPNAGVKPKLCSCIFDVFANKHMRLRINDGRPILTEVTGVQIVPMLHSGVSLLGTDRFSRLLHRITQSIGRRLYERPLPRFAREHSHWHHLPRLFNRDRITFSPERWTPPTEVCRTLLATKGLEKFIAWRRYAKEQNLPILVYVSYNGCATDALMFTDSILAAEVLGKGVGLDNFQIYFQEAFPSPFDSCVKDKRGRHYASEFALSWVGDALFWDQRQGRDVAMVHPYLEKRPQGAMPC